MDEYTIPFDGNRYCGPASLAYVMRSSPREAARLLREVSGKRKIIGTDHAWILNVLAQVGLQAIPAMPVSIGGRLTLTRWLSWAVLSDGEYIVNVTGHCLVIHGDRYFDNGCHLGKPVSRCPYLNKTVVRVWRVTRPAGWEYQPKEDLS